MMKFSAILASICFFFWTCSVPPESVAKKIFSAHGGANFEKVQEIGFTFVVSTPEKELVRRSWIWFPKTAEVKFTEGEKEIKYDRSRLQESDQETEAKFINDSYWLLFPFHLLWDKGVLLSYDGAQPRPDGSGPLRRLSVKYPAEGGFTPGDMYKVYYDSEYKIRYWTYHKSASEEPTRGTTWEGYSVFSGIPLSLQRKGPGGTFQIRFENVSIKP